MLSFRRYVVKGIALCAIACLSPAAYAEFALEPPLELTTDRSVQMAVSSSGQTVLVSWGGLNGVLFRVSNDQGLGFQPEKLVDEPPPENIDGLFLEFDFGAVPMISANGNISRVLASLGLETDPFFPPPGLPPSLHVSLPRLYVSGPLTSVFVNSHKVTPLSDGCFVRPGLACSTLRDFDAAMSADAARIGVIWNAFGLDGQQGDTWFARGTALDSRFDEPLNLSEIVGSAPTDNDFEPRIVTNSLGTRFFALWPVTATGGFHMNLASSLDGGASWSLAQQADPWNDGDMAYANGSDELNVVYSTGFYFLQPPAAIQLVKSVDDGATLSPPVTIALKHELPDGTEMMPASPVRISSSNDGQVIAVLHTEEPCDPIFGCLGGSVLPFDVVLSVSEDGGSTFERVGIVAQTHFAQSLSNTFDVQVRDDGELIFMVSESGEHGGSVFRRAVRQ